MPPHVPDFAIYLPGADSDQNDERQQGVPFGVIHTTEGPDSRGIGQSRHHSTPGTFNFLNRDDGLYCFYPANVRTSHAAGGNNGVGIENEGHTGTPLTPNQIRNLGALVTWLAFNYGIPLTYRTGDPREWVDRTGFRGFIAHRAIAYPPNTSYQHYDEITPAEWAAAIGGSAPAPQAKKDRRMKYVSNPSNRNEVWQTDGIFKSYVTADLAAFYAAFDAALAKELGFTNLGIAAPNQATFDSWIDARSLSAEGPIKRLAAWIAKLFPKKAERAGTP